MSLQTAIPRRVALQHCPSPLHRPIFMFMPPKLSVNVASGNQGNPRWTCTPDHGKLSTSGVGQFRRSKWAMPDDQTHQYGTTAGGLQLRALGAFRSHFRCRRGGNGKCKLGFEHGCCRDLVERIIRRRLGARNAGCGNRHRHERDCSKWLRCDDLLLRWTADWHGSLVRHRRMPLLTSAGIYHCPIQPRYDVHGPSP